MREMTRGALDTFKNLVINLAEFARANPNGDLLQLIATRLDARGYTRTDRLNELLGELDAEAAARPRNVLTLG